MHIYIYIYYVVVSLSLSRARSRSRSLSLSLPLPLNTYDCSVAHVSSLTLCLANKFCRLKRRSGKLWKRRTNKKEICVRRSERVMVPQRQQVAKHQKRIKPRHVRMQFLPLKMPASLMRHPCWTQMSLVFHFDQSSKPMTRGFFLPSL